MNRSARAILALAATAGFGLAPSRPAFEAPVDYGFRGLDPAAPPPEPKEPRRTAYQEQRRRRNRRERAARRKNRGRR